jgi:hypothetical protein
MRTDHKCRLLVLLSVASCADLVLFTLTCYCVTARDEPPLTSANRSARLIAQPPIHVSYSQYTVTMQSLAPLIKAGLGFGPAAAGLAFPAAATAALPVLQRLFSSAATKRLYVGNLNFQTKAEQLAQHFGAYGNVQDVVIPLDNMGRSRGYAFVEMDTEGANSGGAIEQAH